MIEENGLGFVMQWLRYSDWSPLTAINVGLFIQLLFRVELIHKVDENALGLIRLEQKENKAPIDK